VARRTPGSRAEWGNYDARSDLAAKKALAARSAQLSAHPNAGVRSLRKQLGNQAIVDIDPLTGTPRLVGRLNGFLTGPSKARRATSHWATSARIPMRSGSARPTSAGSHCARTTSTSPAPTTSASYRPSVASRCSAMGWRRTSPRPVG
jgi:hypothetical protein